MLGKRTTHPKTMDSANYPGLSFRKFRGKEDLPSMARVENACWKADLVDLVITPDEMEEEFANPINMNPLEDIIIAELDGESVGHGIIHWRRGRENDRLYFVYAFVLPEYMGKGIRDRLLHRMEARTREIAKTHPKGTDKFFDAYANTEENDWKSTLIREGYAVTSHMFEMVRPDLERIPDLPLPKGVEVRPVKPEHYRLIWESAKEALKDERSYSEDRNSEEAFENAMKSPIFTPELWQIAWAGDEVVGGVHNFISREENKRLGRKWGHTEKIFVARAWRKKGIARALIARSLKVLKDQGMEQATLDVDTENPSGALRVYESMGYRPAMHYSYYRKEFS
jgi:mycothiol synthase